MTTKICLLTHWCTNLNSLWSGMISSKHHVQLVEYDANPDIIVVINCTNIPLTDTDKAKTIIFHMEPYIPIRGQWGEWCNPTGFCHVFKHGPGKNEFNCIEWHLDKTIDQLYSSPTKTTSRVSTVISNLYYEPGHISRVDLTRYIDSNWDGLDIYGTFEHYSIRNFGPLKPRCKDDGLMPYKYTIAIENNSIDGYSTEKLWDGILSECLVFYHGNPSIGNIIDSNAIIQIDPTNHSETLDRIKQAIADNEWEQRLPFIRSAKAHILNNLSLFPRILSAYKVYIKPKKTFVTIFNDMQRLRNMRMSK
jgi:hypothetical protein